MKIEFFLDYLPWLHVPRSVCTAWDVTPEDRNQRFTAKKRDQPLVLENAPAPIMELYEWHDLSNISMLWTIFMERPYETPHGWCFSYMSEVLLVLAPEGQVRGYIEHPIRAIHGDGYLGPAGKDMESYLEALLCGQMTVSHFARGLGDEPGFMEKRKPIVDLCTHIAGGEDYRDFWESVLL
ncbi:hypothetical protein V8Z80_09270 [Orrella sp. JC864]|uniref:hypothetical protein n=1 Tax=Orrella sp. JC864 TaxID=3120298 RepID=UPI00300A0F22